jgi:hypothetical protein
MTSGFTITACKGAKVMKFFFFEIHHLTRFYDEMRLFWKPRNYKILYELASSFSSFATLLCSFQWNDFSLISGNYFLVIVNAVKAEIYLAKAI